MSAKKAAKRRKKEEDERIKSIFEAADADSSGYLDAEEGFG